MNVNSNKLWIRSARRMQALDNSIQKLQRNSGQKLKKITMAASLSVTSSLSSSELKPSSRKMLSRHKRNSALG